MKTLLTGGAGYIGTHILCALAEAGREAVCIDNYVNSSPRSLERVSRILGTPVEHYEIDIRDKSGLDRLLAKGDIDTTARYMFLDKWVKDELAGLYCCLYVGIAQNGHETLLYLLTLFYAITLPIRK